MREIHVSTDALKLFLRKGGYYRYMRGCAIGDGRDEDGNAFLIFDTDSECWEQRRKWRFRPRKVNPNMLPGNWLEHLFALFGKQTCPACNIRKRMMNSVGWLGLWRVLAARAFWTGLECDAVGRAGTGCCGKPARVESTNDSGKEAA